MRRAVRLAALAASLLLAVMSAFSASAQEFREAVVAYNQGDYAKAHRGFLSFAEHGDARAQFYLGRMYKEGEGAPQDYAEAARWYRLAANQDEAAAQNNLGLMYENGDGISRNLELAHMWFNLSASRLPASEKEITKTSEPTGFLVNTGNPFVDRLITPLGSETTLATGKRTGSRREKAVRNRDRVAAQLSPMALARAQRMAREWRAGRDAATNLSAMPAADGEGTKSESARLEVALAVAARLREQLEEARQRLAEAREKLSRQREELQLRRTVAGIGEADTTETVPRSVYNDAEARIVRLAVENTRLRDQLADLNAINPNSEGRIAALRQRIDEQIAEIERLEALRRALKAARDKLEAQKVEQVDRLAYLRTRAEKAEVESRLARAQIARLASNIRALKEQVKRLNAALEASEAKAEGAETLVLDARLNSALVRKIDELRRFRSEFVGQLREALAGQQLVLTEDDRFYLPAEVLFLSGSADLDADGRKNVRRIGTALTDVAARIPEDLDWVLRVDGHTDRQRLRDRSRYKTNWGLSVARAIAVVKLLVESGVPAERLAATGFGEFHPLDPADTREAFRRNRRIEFSLMRK